MSRSLLVLDVSDLWHSWILVYSSRKHPVRASIRTGRGPAFHHQDGAPILGNRCFECFEKPKQPKLCLTKLLCALGWHNNHLFQAMGFILQGFYLWSPPFSIQVLWDQRLAWVMRFNLPLPQANLSNTIWVEICKHSFRSSLLASIFQSDGRP